MRQGAARWPLMEPLAPWLSESLLVEALREAAAAEEARRAELLTRHLVSALASRPPAELHALWQRFEAALSGQPSERVLGQLAALAPAIVALGGDDAARQVAAAARQVSEWWP